MTIDDITAEGNGVGRAEGMAVFVPAAAVGDVISCRILKVNKSFAYGKIEQLLEPSPCRADRGCSADRLCGGCTFRHISYDAELAVKENAVRNAFSRLGGFDAGAATAAIIGCSNPDRYRNKAQFPVSADSSGNIVAGFFAKRSHRVVPCTDCLLQPVIFGEILDAAISLVSKMNIPPYNEETGRGILRHICIRQGHYSGEIMVCFVVAANKKKAELAAAADRLRVLFPAVRSVVMNINSAAGNVIMGDRCVTLSGSDTITDIMCGNRITLSPLSFYQINTPQAERLYGIVRELAALNGRQTVLDLYCGTGTVGLSLADSAARIIGAEIVPQAVENARLNARINDIDNADFILADAGKAAEELAGQGCRPDIIITDPPRKGCDELTLSSVIRMSPKRIIMISCKPSTAARDCRYLANNGYSLTSIHPVDMFPGTGHVETVVLMSRVKD